MKIEEELKGGFLQFRGINSLVSARACEFSMLGVEQLFI